MLKKGLIVRAAPIFATIIQATFLIGHAQVENKEEIHNRYDIYVLYYKHICESQ